MRPARLRSIVSGVVSGQNDWPITAGGDDGMVDNDGTDFNATASSPRIGNVSTGSNVGGDAFFMFRSVTIPVGATITAAYVAFAVASNNNPADGDVTIAAIDSATPAAPTSGALSTWGTPTTATVTWAPLPLTTGAENTPSLVAIIQELVDTYDYSAGRDILLTFEGVSAAGTQPNIQVGAFEHATLLPASLHVEWT